MKNRLINIMKSNRVLYCVFYYVGSFILRILGLLFKSSEKQIVFVCSGGKRYGNNIQPIYEHMLTDKRFAEWKFIWGFRKPSEFSLPDCERTIKCKIDTPLYFYYLLKSKCWITSNTVQRGLNFKNKGTIYVNTWHGVPIKHIAADIKKGTSFTTNDVEKFDLLFAEGTYDAQVYESAFKAEKSQIKIVGYPRNEKMLNCNVNKVKKKISERYGFDCSKKIILYAPTFRDYNKDKQGNFVFENKITEEKFQKSLGNQYVLLVRSHGAIQSNSINCSFLNVSDYPIVEDLLIAADVLVTDYSGIMFDFALLEKPIICYCYDKELYCEKRGMYIDYDKFIPFDKCYSEKELYSAINRIDYVQSSKITAEFKNKCGLKWENSIDNAIDEIYNLLKK